MENKENQKQNIFELIESEYYKAYQEILNGTLAEIPTKNPEKKKVFAVKKTGNWGLTTGNTRKGGQKGDTTTIHRLKKLADLDLFSENDFENYKGDLHKAIGGNHVDARDIMLFLNARVVESQQYHSISKESQELGLEEYNSVTEGNRRQVVVNLYERDKSIRDKVLAMKRGRVSCEVCGFDFESVYGKLGKGFIHVHHKKPLFSIGENYHPDIENDFALVCPNCHAMLHRNRKDILTVEKLREMILEQKRERHPK